MKITLKGVVLVLIPVMILNIFLGIFNSKYTEQIIENNWRSQARLQLQSSKYSINRLVEEEKIPVARAVDIVMRKVRNGGPTGDSHGYYLSYAQSLDTSLFFDASSDCKPGDKQYTLNEIILFFKDPKSAQFAFKQVLLGEDSTEDSKLSWNFDGQPEWLEYIKMPNSESNQKEGAYMLVLGTQSDEVNSNYSLIKALNLVYLTLSTLFQLLFMSLFYFLIEIQCKKSDL